MEDRESRKLGHYRLMHRLARGGMSEVYLAKDERDEQVYALKLVKQGNEEDCLRFQQEAQVLMRIKHPHILPILDYSSQEDVYYYVMPYIAQGTVKDRLEKGPLGEKEAETILIQVADALNFLHEAGFVHRDIKPSNILQDETEHVWLADFGLVRAIEGGSDLTSTGYLLGTPFYMAPELGSAQANVGSDIYALGVVLYEMLTARVPFTGKTALDICWKHVYEQPPLPSSLNPLLPAAVEQVILHALEKSPSDRYTTSQELAEAYQKALLLENVASSAFHHPVKQSKDTLTINPVQILRSHKQRYAPRMPLLVGISVTVMLITLSLVSMGVASHSNRSRLPNSPAQVSTAQPTGVSPTAPAPLPPGVMTQTPVPATISGSAPPGITPKTPVSAPSGPTPPGKPEKHPKKKPPKSPD